jgi:pyridinium-3,5-bisthiocarboxylic acid mononucleotide nickel chelatase
MKILYLDSSLGIEEKVFYKALINLGIDEDIINQQIQYIDVEHIISAIEISDFEAVKRVVEQSSLETYVKRLCSSIFKKLMSEERELRKKAEQDTNTSKILVKEAIEYIIKISCCISYLKPNKIVTSRIELGSGVIRRKDRIDIVPSSLSVEILKGLPVSMRLTDFEATTSTAAAILSIISPEAKEVEELIIDKIGYGENFDDDSKQRRSFRVFLGKLRSKEYFIEKNNDSLFASEPYDYVKGSFIKDFQFILECNIDDMNPEFYEPLLQKLFKAGAADVYYTPIAMKKGRPATKISVLTSKDKAPQMEEILLRETTTFGVRSFEVEKTMLQRNFTKVKTIFGEITVKQAIIDGKIIKAKPEYEDCRRLAEENGVPLNHIYLEVYKHINIDK